jgi:hypothetical protein
LIIKIQDAHRLKGKQHFWNMHLQIGTQLRIKSSARLRQSKARVVRFASSDYRQTSSFMAVMKQLNWTPLEVRCNNSRLIMMYRIVYDLADIPPATYIHRNYTVLMTTPLRSMSHNPEHQCTGSHTSCKPSDCRTICPDPW